nr:MAG: hypothetical protein DIU78_06970 [Pseudomonadota bacterium]
MRERWRGHAPARSSALASRTESRARSGVVTRKEACTMTTLGAVGQIAARVLIIGSGRRTLVGMG